MCKWLFHPLDRKATQRESTVGAFFASDVIEFPIQAIIREGIQNALDASDSETMRVRIYLSGNEGALAPAATLRYFDTGRTHWCSPDNGLSLPQPDWNGRCPFLVFEDFGTTGLEGDDRAAHFKDANIRNNFYNFFRAEGQSDKDSNSRGSWGVGKHVFPMFSAIKAFFGLTVRKSDKKQLLMGKTILTMHPVGNESFQDGYFGIEEGEDMPFLPILDTVILEQFKEDFRLKRSKNPGLSIVVPWFRGHEDDDSEMLPGQIALIAAREYYLPIAMKKLVVEVEYHGRDLIRLDSSDAIREILTENEKNLKNGSGELEGWLKMAEYSKNTDGDFVLQCPDSGTHSNAWRWMTELFDKETLDGVKKSLDCGSCTGIRVPLRLWSKGETKPKETDFRIFLLKNDTGKRSRTQCVRQGIMISDGSKTSKNSHVGSKQYFSMIMVEEGPLAMMLQASENPSHTEWQHNQPRVKESYAKGIVTGMDFIKESVRKIADILDSSDTEVDSSLLADVFFVDIPDETSPDQEAQSLKPDKNAGDTSAPPEKITPSKKLIYKIGRIGGGFRVSGQCDSLPPPGRIRIRTAYDTNKGDPFRKYVVDDFRLDEEPIAIKQENVDKCIAEKNVLVITPLSGAFEVEVTGFDENRQLIVEARKISEKKS